MKVTLKGDKALSLRLSNVKKSLLTRAMMGQMGGHAVGLIIERTEEEGKDKDGKSFVKYSKEYLEFKKERGGKFFSNKVNLMDEGHMLGNLDFSVSNDKRVFLHLPKSDEKLNASGHINGQGRLTISSHSRTSIKGNKFNVGNYKREGLKKRNFFGLTNKEKKEVMKIPEKSLKEEVDA